MKKCPDCQSEFGNRKRKCSYCGGVLELVIDEYPEKNPSLWMLFYGFLLNSVGVIAFSLGVLFKIKALMIAGGIVNISFTIISTQGGIFSMPFPLVIYIIVPFFVRPWYLGLFWADFFCMGIVNFIMNSIRVCKLLSKPKSEWYLSLRHDLEQAYEQADKLGKKGS